MGTGDDAEKESGALAKLVEKTPTAGDVLQAIWDEQRESRRVLGDIAKLLGRIELLLERQSRIAPTATAPPGKRGAVDYAPPRRRFNREKHYYEVWGGEGMGWIQDLSPAPPGPPPSDGIVALKRK